jgi:di/tripeptidase
MDCISVGPTCNDGHTVDERLDTSSVQGFYDAIKGVMLALFQERQSEPSARLGEPALASA